MCIYDKLLQQIFKGTDFSNTNFKCKIIFSLMRKRFKSFKRFKIFFCLSLVSNFVLFLGF